MVNAVCLETLRATVAEPQRPVEFLRCCAAAFAAMHDCPLGALARTDLRHDAVLIDAVIACAERGPRAACPLSGARRRA